MIGTSLSHFNITAKLGEGGMGEVYRAEDGKLGREVAIKVLPELLAGDPDRMARFAREAQVLASLNHSNIAAIYGLEEENGRHALVMELVEGETLSERLERGRVPLQEAARIGLQIAEALESAHEKGIVHRDLKPANVKITPDGRVKVLDFGLAKALEQETATHDIEHSPTLTAAATQAGIILGTAAYMSPEQAAGSPADRRADVWSFGVVLMELLTGARQFEGQTVSHVLASVLKDEPDLGRLPEEVPPRLRELLSRCLRKEAQNRLQAIGEARILLQEYLADPASFEPAASTEVFTGPSPASSKWSRALPWLLLVISMTTLGAALWKSTHAPPARPVRSTVELPKTQTVFGGYGSSAIIAPDGHSIAFVMQEGGQLFLYLQSLDRWEPEPVESGTTGENSPYHPFFSPDSKWLGFVTPSKLKKVPVQGGTAITLCDVQLSRGASWGDDDFIVFAPSPASGLQRVSAAAGEPEVLTELAEGEATHRWPQVLPGAKAVLFTSHDRLASFDDATLEVLDLETGERSVLHRGGSFGRYLETGHLVYAREGTIFALPFDLNRMEVTGSAFPVLDGVGHSRSQGGAHFDVSRNGQLIYIDGTGEAPEWHFVSVDRVGEASKLWEEGGLYRFPRLSPDGGRLLFDLFNESSYDLWIYEIERGVATRFTFSDANDTRGVWTPDGSSIIFGSSRTGTNALYRKPADGSGEAVRIGTSESAQLPWSVSPDGKTLAYQERGSETGWDIWTMPLDGSGEPEPFLVSEFQEGKPAFSPDGLWISYDSNESGKMEVYVRSALGGAGKWQVSSGGGAWSRWARGGRELYYRTPGGEVNRVAVGSDEAVFRAGSIEEVISSGAFVIGGANSNFFDVQADGERLVLLDSGNAASPDSHTHARLILDWHSELESLLEP